MSEQDLTLQRRLAKTAIHRRDRLVLYPQLDPRRTALLVIDMQEAFLGPDSAAWVPSAGAIVAPIQTLANRMRLAGATVVFTRHTVVADDWPRYVEVVAGGSPFHATALLGPGAPGHALFHAFEVHASDIVVNKTRFGALGAEHSCLHAELMKRHIDTVVIAGTLTNICCESTARQAMELDYRTLMAADATAARTDAAQIAALLNVFSAFGDVANVGQICDRLME